MSAMVPLTMIFAPPAVGRAIARAEQRRAAKGRLREIAGSLNTDGEAPPTTTPPP
jgi:hypothetical protein